VLVAVVDGNQLAEVDIARGSLTTRSLAPVGLYLGPPALRDDTTGASYATLLALTPSRGFVLTVDVAGQELLRAPIASFTPVPLPDGGTTPLAMPEHVGPLVDDRGTIAFASTDGHVGVVSPEGSVDTIGELLCAKGARSGVKGLTPFGKGAFAVTCDGGVVHVVAGTGAETRTPATAPPPSASAGKLRRRDDF
jgi:hypothetical protein